MILITFTALLAVCSADKLDRTYLPPPSAQSAGGSPGSLQAPFATKTFNQGLGGLPHGGFSNEHDGVVVEAAAAGTRSSEFGISGLGAPRINYGSFNSKVGDAAFKEAPQQPFGSSPGAQNFNTQQNFGQGSLQNSNARQDFSQSTGSQNSAPQQPERPQAAADRAASTVKFESDVDTDKFNYAFETDNGITAEENGVDSNGIQAQGGFSYTGDDGQVYSITYTADEGGYKPQGSHLPTAPPIPKEILESLEKNAQDEAAGIIDDGSYDARKYNAGSEYTESENENSKYNGSPNVFSNRRESAASASGSFNQNTFSRPGQNSFTSSSASFNSESGASSQNRPISNGFRPSAENQDQSGQSGQTQPNGVPDQNSSLNSKPSSSFRPQASAFNNGAQFISQAGNADMKDSDSNGAEALLNVDKYKDKPALGNYNGFNSQQNTVNRPPGFVNSQFSSSFESNTFSLNSNKPQTPNRFSSNNEYLPPKNSFQSSSSNKLQGSISDTSLPSSQNIQSSLTFPSPFNQANRQTQQQNSFQQNSASAQDSGMFSLSGRPISSNLMSQNVNNRFNYQQPTLQPDTSLTTPFVDSSSFSSNSQSSVNSQYSRPVGLGQMTGNSQISNSMSTNIPNYEQQSQEFPKRVTSSASASASFSLQAAIPTSAQATSSNRQNIATSFQFNQNQPALGRPSAINENGQKIVSQNYATGTNQPSISQISQYQDSNDAYYYNQPGQSFKTPTQPSLQSNQLNQFSQQTATGGQVIQSNAFANQGPSTTVTYPSPQTVAPTVPTSATQNNLGLNQVPQFSGITQATATSFVSNMPSLPLKSQSPTQQSFSSQSNKFAEQSRRPAFEQRPTTGAPSFLQLNQQQTSQNINERPAVTSQQFTGEIYQYNKPPQVFPAPDAQSDSEKNTQFQIASSMAEGITGAGRPQFDLSPVTNEQSKGEIYDYKKPPQIFPASAEPTKTELNTNNEVPTSAGPSQTAQQTQFGQVSYQPTKPASANQQISEKPSPNKQPSDGSSIRPICCKSSLPTGSISSPTGSVSFPAVPSIPVQSGSNAFGFQGTQSSSYNLAGRGEVFSESRKPPSYDPETGYHY